MMREAVVDPKKSFSFEFTLKQTVYFMASCFFKEQIAFIYSLIFLN